METKNVWSLKCKYYTKTFNTLDELMDDVMISGMDPNYMITCNGKSIGEKAIEHIMFQVWLMMWINIYLDIRKINKLKTIKKWDHLTLMIR